jgi:hypothetical protein
MFIDKASPSTLYVPAGTKALYQSLAGWNSFTSIVEYDDAAGFSVYPLSVTFPATAGTQTLSVTANNASWTAVSSAEWLSLSPASGTGNATVSLTVAANTGNARTAIVTLTANGTVQTVAVTQAAAGAQPGVTLTVTPASLDFPAAGSTQTLTVASNTTWTAVSSAEWLSVSPASGTNNGGISLTATASTSVARTATVTLTGGGAVQTVAITQAAGTQADAVLTVTPASLDFPAAGSTQTLTVASNASWTAISSAEWLSVSPASGTNNDSISLTATANTGAMRAATVTLTGGGLIHAVAVTQAAGQQIVVESALPAPAGSEDTLRVSLSNAPVDKLFVVQFVLTLPTGFGLNAEATALFPSWGDSYVLTLSAAGANRWLFLIQPGASTPGSNETGYRELVDIVYTIAPSMPPGGYEGTLHNAILNLSDGTTVRQEEINVPLIVKNTTGLETIQAPKVWYDSGILTINTPKAEEIAVYSIAGTLLYQGRKAAGEVVFRINWLPKGVLIVKGESGWVKKIVQ